MMNGESILDKLAAMEFEKKLKQQDMPLEDPWIDPVSAFAGGFGGRLPSALQSGKGILEALVKSAISGGAGAVADIPIGQLTEVVGQKAPWAATPFNIGAGMISGVTFEKALEEALINPKQFVNPIMNMDGWLAYHGGPHKWPAEPDFPHGRPRLDKIGTGEGAAAYGHGWYSADLSDVGKTYVPRDYEYEDKLSKMYNMAERKQDYAAMEVLESAMLHETPIEIEKRFLQSEEYDDVFKKSVKKTIEAIKKIPQKGALYRVDIPDSVLPRLLDWDRPLSEQSEYVKNALAESGIIDLWLEHNNSGPDGFKNLMSTMTGSYLYNFDKLWELADKNGAMSFDGDKSVSEFFAKIGIPGNRYFDGNSRADGQGTFNYVIWDQDVLDRVKILERNGEKLLDALSEVKQ